MNTKTVKHEMAIGRDETSVGARYRHWFEALTMVVLCALLVGCTSTRSISNSSPNRVSCGGPVKSSDPGFEYRGELNEFDVLGLDRTRIATEEEIARSLDQAKAVELRPGIRVLLVQSGAVFPDGRMVTEMERHFRVVPFSGVPLRHRTATDPEPLESFSYSKSLRLAAARAGAETIICYWGTLESTRRKMETKTVSWVPVAGWMLPDESQLVRIRLKLALVDVRTGLWRLFTPEPFSDKAWSTGFTRGSSDLKQVEALKTKAYAAGVKLLASE